MKGVRFWLIQEDMQKEDERYSLLNTPVFDTDQMPMDYRMLITTGPFNLHPNQTVRIANLITFSLPCNGINANGTDSDIECVDGLIAKVKAAYEYYYTRLLSEVTYTQKAADDLNISPNPASDFIEISVGAQRAVPDDVAIFDLLGMEITTPSDLTPGPSPRGEGSSLRVDVSHLSPGVYFVRVGDVVRKFVKI